MAGATAKKTESLIWTLRTMTNTERVRALRQRRADLGLKRMDVYAHPDDQATIKELAAKLQNARQKRRKKIKP